MGDHVLVFVTGVHCARNPIVNVHGLTGNAALIALAALLTVAIKTIIAI